MVWHIIRADILRVALYFSEPHRGEEDTSNEQNVRSYFMLNHRIRGLLLACENVRFSSLFVAEDVSRGGTSATQWQKFHTDDANQCLHNKSGSHGVSNINLSNFACLLVDFGKVLCWSAHELQQNSNASSREDYIAQILTVLLEILRVYIWPFWPFVFCLSFVKQLLKQCNCSVDQSALLTGFWTDFTSSLWNFCRWVADVPPRETSSATKSEEKRTFLQASLLFHYKKKIIWQLASIFW